jgi:tRNA nucleotidyltransferase (CCA-adding enzyme)
LSTTRIEKSAGFLIFRKENGVIRYLFLTNKGRYDVPKGVKQPGESDLTAALRELKEETGIVSSRLIPGLKWSKHYFYTWGRDLVSKDVVYFLAETKDTKIRISDEHDGYSWLTKDEALARIRYKGLREILQDAEAALTAPLVG